MNGLVVNRKANIRREYRHSVWAMVHRLFRTGKFEVSGPVTRNGQRTFEERDGTLDELHGRPGFIDRIDLRNKEIADQGEEGDHLSTKESPYRQFSYTAISTPRKHRYSSARARPTTFF